MKPITRYAVYSSNDNICSDPNPSGEWVDFEDHEARMVYLQDKLDHAQDALEDERLKVANLEERLDYALGFSD
jgi:hypothetical protein